MLEWIIGIVAVVVIGGGAFLTLRIAKRRSQNQFVGKGGQGIQSGRDTKIDSGRDTNFR